MSDSSSDPVTSNEQEEIEIDRSSTPTQENQNGGCCNCGNNNNNNDDDDHVRAADVLASMRSTPITQYSNSDDDNYQSEPFEWDFGDEEEQVKDDQENDSNTNENMED